MNHGVAAGDGGMQRFGIGEVAGVGFTRNAFEVG
jgi:hypothetical protein